MGYTHYWIPKEEIRNNRIKTELLNVIKAICFDYQNIICCDSDAPRPEVNKETIFLNGIGKDECETFYFDFENSCCKTNRKPYDIVVCLILMAMKYFYKDGIEITTDYDDVLWANAKTLIGEYLPDSNFTFKKREFNEMELIFLGYTYNGKVILNKEEGE